MFHRIVVFFICFAMTGLSVIPHSSYAGALSSSPDFSEAELLNKYPTAKIIRVSADEYLTLEKKLQQRGYQQSEVVPLQLAENNIKQAEAVDITKNNLALVDDCAETVQENAGEESLRVMVDFTDDIMKSSNGSSGDAAAVLFVVVGTVVVIVWALYVFKYLYDISFGSKPCGLWNELTLSKSVASTIEGQHARFDGLRYSTGFRDGSLDVGFGVELGQADILLSEVGILELKGRYWLLGPILRWRLSQGINPSYFQMNFVAGTTEHDEVGMLAKASLGLLFGIGDSMQLGLNWGAMNINLNENQGVISERSQYHYLYGINMGFRF